MRSELLHQRVYNFQGMTISDQCMSIQNLLEQVVFKQLGKFMKQNKLFTLQKNLNHSTLT